MSKARALTSRWSMIFFLAFSCGGAWAQAEPADPATTEEEEITVTARLLEEPIENVPATVSVLTEAQIEAAGIERADDFIKLVPGVTMVNAAEVGDTQVNIRGINGSRDAENSFAFIVDGILMTNPAAFNRELSNLRQIEVLKGPQGALYGRNAAAGAVIVSTSLPPEKESGELLLSVAGDNSYLGSFSVGGSAGERSRYRIHGDWRSSDGFYRNVFLGDEGTVDNFEGYNLDGRLVLDTAPGTRWDFKARYGEVEAGAITFNASFALPDFATVLGQPAFFEDVNQHEFVFQSNIDPRNDQKAFELSAKVDHELSFGKLTAWALVSDIDNSLSADGTSGAFGFFNGEPNCRASVAALFAAGLRLPAPQFLGPNPGASIFGPYTPTTCDGTQFQERKQQDLSTELRLAGKVGDKLGWQTGLYYLNIDREVGVNLGIDTGRGVTPELFVPRTGSNPTEQLVHDNFKTDVVAIFGALQYRATEALELAVALRFDQEKRKVKNLVPTDARTQYIDFTLDGNFSGGAPLNPGLDRTINPSGAIAPQDETFDQLQPRLSARWHSSERFTLFGSWGVGFKSGGFNNQGSRATTNIFFNQLLGTDLVIEDQFAEETSSAFEIGFKSRLSSAFYLEAAAFKTDVDDMQFFEFLVGPFGLLRVVSNIDKVTIQGGEIGFRWEPTTAWRIAGGYSVNDSEIEKNSSRPATVGNESPYTPESTGNLAIELSLPVSDRFVVNAGVYFTAIGATWFHTVQDDKRVTLFNAFFPGLGTADYSLAQRDAYETVDLRVGLSNEAWGITLFANNLTDETYLEEVIVAPEFGGSFIHPGAERRAGVEITYRF